MGEVLADLWMMFAAYALGLSSGWSFGRWRRSHYAERTPTHPGGDDERL